jgi:hypothetical protein
MRIVYYMSLSHAIRPLSLQQQNGAAKSQNANSVWMLLHRGRRYSVYGIHYFDIRCTLFLIYGIHYFLYTVYIISYIRYTLFLIYGIHYFLYTVYIILIYVYIFTYGIHYLIYGIHYIHIRYFLFATCAI